MDKTKTTLLSRQEAQGGYTKTGQCPYTYLLYTKIGTFQTYDRVIASNLRR